MNTLKKNKLNYFFAFIIFIATLYIYNENNKVDYDEIRKKHSEFLENSPYKETKSLQRDERKKLQLPPNAYAERMWELSMNPYTGRTEPEKLFYLQKELREKNDPRNLIPGVPGEPNNEETKWVHRGPYNVGGRTKGIMWDPNDSTNETVFAGGISGGIFKNKSISNQNSPWVLVDETLPQNLAVSSITYDPNDTKTFYVGTGESYTGGDALGNGLWKSTNGGDSWEKVMGGDTSASYESGYNVVEYVEPAITKTFRFSEANFGPGVPTENPIIENVVWGIDQGAEFNGTEEGDINMDGCDTFTNATALNGKIAVVYRGGCFFAKKAANAAAAGAKLLIIVNRDNGDEAWTTSQIITMASPNDGSVDLSSINMPTIMISWNDGHRH